MATLAIGAGDQPESTRTFEQARKVGFSFASVDDADTFVAGPNVMSAAWEGTTVDTAEVGWRLTDRATGTFEADCAAAGNVGTLWVFYGHSGRAV